MAQYQPFVLQVQRPGPKFSTGEGAEAEVALLNHAKDGGKLYKAASAVHEDISSYWGQRDWGQRAWMMVTGVLCVVALVLFFILLVLPLGRIDKMTNTKSMHFTRNKNSYTWVSLFPSQAYMEKQSIVTYSTVDGVLDKADVNPSEEHGFQIAGGFGILTNISTNVYVSALLVIYAISLLDAAVFDQDHPEKGRRRKIYFTWATITLGVLFVLTHLFIQFSTWHELEWGKSKIKVTYMWESGASLFYASLVVALFIVHVNVKHHTWSSIIPGISEQQHGDKNHGTPETGPYGNEADIMFAFSFFLLVMGLLGDTRQTVLETEAQLLVLSAVGLAVITVLSTRVRSYFHFIEHNYLRENLSHKMMVLHTLKLVELISLAVTFAFFGIAFNVLATMYDSSEWNLFFLTVIVVTSFYMFIKFVHLFMELVGFTYTSSQDGKDKWTGLTKAYYLISIMATLLVVIVLLAYSDDKLDILRQLESAQHISMDKAVLKPNTACLTNGMQSNGLLYTELELNPSSTFKIADDLKNPIVFKVNAWTNWWHFGTDSTALGPDLFLCSTGLEQEFGSCRAQYRARNGKVYSSALQTPIDLAASSFVTSPT